MTEKKIPIKITDDKNYDPKQVHMVTGQELLDYLIGKSRKNQENIKECAFDGSEFNEGETESS